MNTFLDIKNHIIALVGLLEKTKSGSSKNIQTWLDTVGSIPLIKLYTVEGMEMVEKSIYDVTENTQSDVLEFLLRLKPLVCGNETFNQTCYNFIKEDKVIQKFYDGGEFNQLEIKQDSMDKYYVLNLILAYNTAI